MWFSQLSQHLTYKEKKMYFLSCYHMYSVHTRLISSLKISHINMHLVYNLLCPLVYIYIYLFLKDFVISFLLWPLHICFKFTLSVHKFLCLITNYYNVWPYMLLILFCSLLIDILNLVVFINFYFLRFIIVR